MAQLWREIYFRISLAGGMIALLLMTSGFSLHTGNFVNWFKPKDLYPSPVVVSCEAKINARPPLRGERPSWCQASAEHRVLDAKKTRNIF